MYSEHINYKQVKDFSNLQIKEIALRYATTPYNWSAKAIATEYSRDGEYTIKPRTISKLIQKAIKTGLVSEKIAKKIKEKAVYNAARHSKYSAMITSDKYDELIQLRKDFLKHDKEDEKIQNVTIVHESFESEEEYINRIKTEERYLLSKINLLNHQIDSFYDYCTDESPPLSEFTKEKDKIQEELKKLKFYNPC